MKKKILYVLAGILLLLIVTNPSAKSFKDYLGSNTYNGLRRTSNFFVCSIYSNGNRYFAIAGNFFIIKTCRQTAIPENTKNKDTFKHWDSNSPFAPNNPDTSKKNRAAQMLISKKLDSLEKMKLKK